MQNKFDNVNESNRNVLRERKQMKSQKDEAIEYSKKQEELVELKSKYFRWQLYHIKREMEEARIGIKELDDEIENLNDEQEDKSAELGLNQVSFNQKQSQTRKLNNVFKKSRKKCEDQELTLRETKLSVDECRNKINEIDEELEEYERKQDESTMKINEIETDLNNIDIEIDEFEKEKKEQMEIKLEESQYQEYLETKNEANQQTARLKPRLQELRSAFQRKQVSFVLSCIFLSLFFVIIMFCVCLQSQSPKEKK